MVAAAGKLPQANRISHRIRMQEEGTPPLQNRTLLTILLIPNLQPVHKTVLFDAKCAGCQVVPSLAVGILLQEQGHNRIGLE